jgi:hypothetical protein
LQRGLRRFCDRFGELVSPARQAFYERFLDRLPSLLARYQAHRHMTICCGDAHVWNCFLPNAQTSEDVRLFDWEVWDLYPATADLSYMMAVHWYPELRRRIEVALLDEYHDALLAAGVRGYDRHALTEDYRLSVLLHITLPPSQALGNIPPRVWWNNLERILLAVEDLGCRELLD